MRSADYFHLWRSEPEIESLNKLEDLIDQGRIETEKKVEENGRSKLKIKIELNLIGKYLQGKIIFY